MIFKIFINIIIIIINMEQQLKRFANIVKIVNSEYFNDLGKVELIINDNIDMTLWVNSLLRNDIIKFKIIPHEGIHKNIEYILTIKFQEQNWPHIWPFGSICCVATIYIDSEIYDKIKTIQYLQNKGFNGIHKGICIKNLSYGYPFIKNFKELCDNKWENYIYYLITVFNNIQDFEKGNGIKSNYKTILQI